MDFEYDSAKDVINRAKHGVSLALGHDILSHLDVLIVQSFRDEDGERRFKAVAPVEGKLHTAIFAWRSGRARFISVRRSNSGEEKLYHHS